MNAPTNLKGCPIYTIRIALFVICANCKKGSKWRNMQEVIGAVHGCPNRTLQQLVARSIAVGIVVRRSGRRNML
nr:hypothetical protein Iba_chr12bCG16290 [Ipomoea batatas]